MRAQLAHAAAYVNGECVLDLTTTEELAKQDEERAK